MDTQGRALMWALTLFDPLLPDARRQAGVGQMDQMAAEDPEWAAVFFGGVAANIAGTLPVEDSWRTLAAAIGPYRRGAPQLPPGVAGATWPDGATFGEWVDFTDIAPLVSDVPETDPELAAVADPIDQRAAAIIPFAFDGWRRAADVITALARTGTPLGPPSRDAVRALIVRRRSYGVESDDPWIFESIYDWSWMAEHIVTGWTPDDNAITERIIHERIR